MQRARTPQTGRAPDESQRDDDHRHDGVNGRRHDYVSSFQRRSLLQKSIGFVGVGACLLLVFFALSPASDSAIHRMLTGNTTKKPTTTTTTRTTTARTTVREYFLEAQETVWDFAPAFSTRGIEQCSNSEVVQPQVTGFDVNGFPIYSSLVPVNFPWSFMAGQSAVKGPSQKTIWQDYAIGSKYKKRVWKQFTDKNFNKEIPRTPEWEHLGFYGPTLRTTVGEKLKVNIRNKSRFPVSFQASTLLLTGFSSLNGAPIPPGCPKPGPRRLPTTFDQAGYQMERPFKCSGFKCSGNFDQIITVLPGEAMVFTFDVPESAGPDPQDFDTVARLYQSPQRYDDELSLSGVIVVSKAGKNGKPDSKKVQQELVEMFSISKESDSPYLDLNVYDYIVRARAMWANQVASPSAQFPPGVGVPGSGAFPLLNITDIDGGVEQILSNLYYTAVSLTPGAVPAPKTDVDLAVKYALTPKTVDPVNGNPDCVRWPADDSMLPSPPPADAKQGYCAIGSILNIPIGVTLYDRLVKVQYLGTDPVTVLDVYRHDSFLDAQTFPTIRADGVKRKPAYDAPKSYVDRYGQIAAEDAIVSVVDQLIYGNYYFDQPRFQETNNKHTMNGFIFCNQPGLKAAEGTSVRWYLASIGAMVDVHTSHWHGNTLLQDGGKFRTDSIPLIPMILTTADMKCDNPGRWLYHCHVTDHINAGMLALYEVTAMREKDGTYNVPMLPYAGVQTIPYIGTNNNVMMYPAPPVGVRNEINSKIIRSFYIAVEDTPETDLWDYNNGGIGQTLCKNIPGAVLDPPFATTPPESNKVRKVRYVQYDDESFDDSKRTVIPDRWRHKGIVGPIIRAEVGDTIRVVFRNKLPAKTKCTPADTTLDCTLQPQKVSMHPHGVLYRKRSEGALYYDGTPLNDRDHEDDAVPSGKTVVQYWWVPESAGPGPNDGETISWLYHGHVHEAKDENAGMIGAILITKRGSKQRNGDLKPANIDREFVLFYKVFDDVAGFVGPDPMPDDQAPVPQLRYTINGYSQCGVPGMSDETQLPVPFKGPDNAVMEGDRVRWYLLSQGNEIDVHRASFQGHTVQWQGHTVSGVPLVPGIMRQADMVAHKPGKWLLYDGSVDLRNSGTFSMFEIKENDMRRDVLMKAAEPPSCTKYFIQAEEVDWDYLADTVPGVRGVSQAQYGDICTPPQWRSNPAFAPETPGVDSKGTNVNGFPVTGRLFIRSEMPNTPGTLTTILNPYPMRHRLPIPYHHTRDSDSPSNMYGGHIHMSGMRRLAPAVTVRDHRVLPFIGHKYTKNIFREYKRGDYSFTQQAVADPSLGYMGPAIRAAVGDTFKVVFKNNLMSAQSARDVNFIIEALHITKMRTLICSDAGAQAEKLQAQGVGMHMGGDMDCPANCHWEDIPKTSVDEGGVLSMYGRYDSYRVMPGQIVEYTYRVGKNAEPSSGDASTISWPYLSNVDDKFVNDQNTPLRTKAGTDFYAGLMGAVVVGKTRADAFPSSRSNRREFLLNFLINDETLSPLYEYNVDKYAVTNPGFAADGWDKTELMNNGTFIASNMMFAINGRMFCGLPNLQVSKNQSVRWHLMALGSSIDLHSALNNAGAMLWTGSWRASMDLYPGTSVTTDQPVVKQGNWIVEDGVDPDWKSGMRALFQVV